MSACSERKPHDCNKLHGDRTRISAIDVGEISLYRRSMLYMIIERFARGGIEAVAERFRLQGRLMPEGLNYVASWLDPGGTICYQVMETENATLLDEWMSHWSDIVDFEVTPVLASAEFWSSWQTRNSPLTTEDESNQDSM